MSIRNADESGPFVPRVRWDSMRVEIYPSSFGLQGGTFATITPRQLDPDFWFCQDDLPFGGRCGDRRLEAYSRHVIAHLTDYAHHH